MATTRINLRGKDSKKPQPIYLIFRHQTVKLTYSTGFKVLPKYWNDDKQRVKNVTHVTNRDTINNFLNDLETECLRYAGELIREKKVITKEGLKKHLNIYLKREIDVGKSLFTFIDDFIKKAPDNVNPSTGKKISFRTVQRYKTARQRLQDFQAQYDRVVDFDTIDQNFYEDFTNYLTGLNYSVNTIGKYIANLKTFLNAATAKNYNKNYAYTNRAFKVVGEESQSIYLTKKEIETIYALDLSNNPRLEGVRDLFIVGCWTGLRYSDFTEIKPKNITPRFLKIEQSKTMGVVMIPLHPTVKAILQKYDNQLPKPISNQKMNDYLKEIGELAEINEDRQKGITKGGVRIITTYKKWQLITTHTARRSFATNLYLSGFPAISIMKITGHKTERDFLKYIKISPQQNAEMLALHWEGKARLLQVVK